MDENENIEILQGLVKTMAELGIQESGTIRSLRAKNSYLLEVIKTAAKHHQGQNSVLGQHLRETIEQHG